MSFEILSATDFAERSLFMAYYFGLIRFLLEGLHETVQDYSSMQTWCVLACLLGSQKESYICGVPNIEEQAIAYHSHRTWWQESAKDILSKSQSDKARIAYQIAFEKQTNGIAHIYVK